MKKKYTLLCLLLAVCMISAGMQTLAWQLQIDTGQPVCLWPDGWYTSDLSNYKTEKGINAFAVSPGKTGNYAMKILSKSDKKASRIFTRIFGLEPEGSYTVSCYVKGDIENVGGNGLGLLILDHENRGQSNSLAHAYTKKTGVWTLLSLTLSGNIPTNGNVVIALDSPQISDSESVLWDDVNLEGKTLNGGFEEVSTLGPATFEIPEDSPNLLALAGSFEDDSLWHKYNPSNEIINPMISFPENCGRNGSRAAAIHYETSFKTNYNAIDPYCSIKVPVSPNSKYLLTGYCKMASGTLGVPRVKVEFYKDMTKYSSQGTSLITGALGEVSEWKQFYQVIDTMPNCNVLAILPRLYFNTGTAFFDDFALYQLESFGETILSTDSVYLYPDNKAFTASLSVIDDTVTGRCVDFSLWYGKEKLAEETGISLTDTKVDCRFSSDSMLAKKGSAYSAEFTLKCTVYKDDQVQETYQTPIYMYDRPKNLPQSGIYQKNGMDFYPYFCYSVPQESYSTVKAAGMNTVQVTFETEAGLATTMAKVREADLMAMIYIHLDGESLISEDNVNIIKSIIKTYQNDPNVLGYLLLDEPFDKLPYFTCIETLSKAYKLIRDIDKMHPVMLNDNRDASFTDSAKFCDILLTDPYPAKKDDKVGYVLQQTDKLRQAAKVQQKTFYPILQAFRYYDMLPDSALLWDMVRASIHMGATGIGYYRYCNADGESPLSQTALWPSIQEISKELPILYESNINLGEGVKRGNAMVYSIPSLSAATLYEVSFIYENTDSTADIICGLGTAEEIEAAVLNQYVIPTSGNINLYFYGVDHGADTVLIVGDTGGTGKITALTLHEVRPHLFKEQQGTDYMIHYSGIYKPTLLMNGTYVEGIRELLSLEILKKEAVATPIAVHGGKTVYSYVPATGSLSLPIPAALGTFQSMVWEMSLSPCISKK